MAAPHRQGKASSGLCTHCPAPGYTEQTQKLLVLQAKTLQKPSETTTVTKCPKNYQKTNKRETPLGKHFRYQRVQDTPMFVLFLHVTSLVSFRRKAATRKERNI